jgi:signal transduction histidine kinase
MAMVTYLRNLKLGAKLNLALLATFGSLLATILVVVINTMPSFSLQTGQRQLVQGRTVILQRFREAEQDALNLARLLAKAPGLSESVKSADATRIRTIALSNAAQLGIDTVAVTDLSGQRLFQSAELAGETDSAHPEDALLSMAQVGIEATGIITIHRQDGLALFVAGAVRLQGVGDNTDVIGGVMAGRIIDDEYLQQLDLSRNDVRLALVVDGKVVAEHASSPNNPNAEDEIKAAHAVGSLTLDGVPLEQAAIAKALTGVVVDVDGLVYSDEGTPFSMAYIPLKSRDKVVGVLVLQTELQGLVSFERQLSSTLILIIVVLALVAVGAIAVFTNRSVFIPLNRLKTASDQMATGNYSQRAETSSKDEIGQLAQAFNTMAEAVEKREIELRSNVTDLEKARVERERLIRELREASRLKSEFLSTMSHELRTPLNAMIGFTELMLAGVSGPMSDKQKHQLGRVHANSLRLLSLIDDVLDLSRIEAGRIEIHSEPFSPKDMAARLTAQISSLVDRKALQFSVDIDETLPTTLLGDQPRLEQILINLLSNAFKFTEKGEVVLSMKPLFEREEWALSVRDTGIGIPPHAQEYIFEQFRQVDGSSRRIYGGSGLGLTICRNLCRLMDGDIRVQSTLGEGSTFTITLPLKVAEPVALSTN